MMKAADRNFFKPLWIRILTTAFCALWAISEWATQQPLWGMIFSGFTAYCIYHFFYAWDEEDEEQ
jgi:hypothetical protein